MENKLTTQRECGKKRRKKIFLFFFESTRSVSHPRAAADSAGTHTQNGMKPIMKRYCESKETFPIQNVLPSSPGPPTHTNIYSEKQKKKREIPQIYFSPLKVFLNLILFFLSDFFLVSLRPILIRKWSFSLSGSLSILPLAVRRFTEMSREEKRKIPRRKTFLLLILFFRLFRRQ